MGYIIDINSKTTPRQLLDQLTKGFAGDMDTPIEFFDFIEDDCNPVDIVRIKIKIGQGLEVHFYSDEVKSNSGKDTED